MTELCAWCSQLRAPNAQFNSVIPIPNPVSATLLCCVGCVRSILCRTLSSKNKNVDRWTKSEARQGIPAD